MHLKESQTVISLSLIMAFRMLGLFMILPVFSAYAHLLPGNTNFLMGCALGIYGLTQACLQLPFGMLSDKIGRKPVIAIGLLLFALGSLLAALSHTIYGIIAGRALQGAGAIGSTCIALIADLTRDENRSKAMAIIGLSIGLSFTIALIIGPLINQWFHLSGIFWATMLFAVAGLLLLVFIPTPPKLLARSQGKTVRAHLKSILTHRELLRLDFGIACSHALLTSTFIAIPLILTHMLHLTNWQQTTLYLLVLGLSFCAMLPFIIIAEKKRHMKFIFCSAIFLLATTQAGLLLWDHQHFSVLIILFVFFTAFTLLEATLPSLVSKIAPIRLKGTATGVYSSAQFFGIFVGGLLGGWLYSHFGVSGIFTFGTLVALTWFMIAIPMKQPPYLSTVIIAPPKNLPLSADDYHRYLSQFPGVHEVAFLPDDNLIYIKIDKHIIDENKLRNLLQESTLRSNHLIEF